MANKKRMIFVAVAILTVVVLATVGGSFYMLDFALAPEENRSDTAVCYQRLFETYPEMRPWVDSLRSKEALRDTFVTMPTGERHHALYVNKGSKRTAVIVHGWRDCCIDFLYLARLYEKLMGYNVVMPDLHASGLSEGENIQMGWLDRLDVLHWLTIFQTDTMVVHGVSMGAATTMMLSAERLPKAVKDIHFVADCGYTSAWDEFTYKLGEMKVPAHPLIEVVNAVNKVVAGYDFKKDTSAIEAVKRSKTPTLFVHGDADAFVPTKMVYEVYDACACPDKDILIVHGADHAASFITDQPAYEAKLDAFIEKYVK